MDGLSHKMRKGSLDFNDVEFFANLLGYEISLKKLKSKIIIVNISTSYILIILRGLVKVLFIMRTRNSITLFNFDFSGLIYSLIKAV